ncbi:ThuA domain-containing protein [Phycisphaera mikurensis]|uniref:ThuA-like domain-containing protein n=1 Tax=Phycisphaera mikurensis (strain NBRC 102666 / KCTC 22515 / FYK2301M01) TaxID=1142394 RepID=I0IC11_PHYMF|nr:ThuA domain-containing protein [Phycisphaera mikurensis]MBB6441977.1 hypothetical protein [Phycisphaera mikurensis]BAM02799.1 hypothetical protein PSMK_06400 [Phycisphaera mikurensis NBRC 102666]
MSKILFIQGGWDGHHPAACAELFAGLLRDRGHEATVSDTLDTLTDADATEGLGLLVPVWTMGEISTEQWEAMDGLIRGGCGIAGFHGGMVDAFRANCDYQWMTGAQWVAHPGNEHLTYDVAVTDRAHPITRGLPASFTLGPTEQYYCHHDPGNRVLCTTTFDQAAGDPSLYRQGVVMPYAWTKTWGSGRVFCAAWGHTPADFDDPTAREIVLRGMEWASR